MKEGYRLLGDFIRQVDVRNTDGKEENLLGVSVQKMFIPSIANTVGTDFTKYKEVKRGQFTYIPDTSRRGDKIGIALLTDYDEGLVSNIYTVFEVKDENELLPEYLMLWFSRPEFDRYARFKSHGSVREIMDWDEMCKVELPVPSIDKQRSIVKAYQTITERIELKRRINDNLEQQAQAVFRQELLQNGELPPNWTTGSLLDIADYLNGLAMQKFRPVDGERGLPVLKIKELRQGFCDYSSELCSPNIKPEFIVHDGDVIFSWSGSLLVDLWCGGTCGLNQHLFKVTSVKYPKWFYYTWTAHHLARFVAIAADKATTMGHIKREDLAKAEVIIPDVASMERIGGVLQPIYNLVINQRIENRKLSMLRDSLLPKLMSGELDVSAIEL